MLNQSIRIVLDSGNKGWILEKLANGLTDQLSKLGFASIISNTPKYDGTLNIWMHYMDETLLDFVAEANNVNLMRKIALVTHVDDSLKLARLKFLFDSGVHLIFMSPQHAAEVQLKLDIKNPFDVLLLPSDFAFIPRRFRMGIVSKCYPDGRKNEKWIIEFAKKGILTNSEIYFVGKGWESTAYKLRNLGVATQLYNDVENPYPNYGEIQKFYQSIDLYFYFGFDEGALGSLDAYIFKTDFLISNQGFHSLFETDPGSLFNDFEDALGKLKAKIEKFEKWSNSVNQWTWGSFSAGLIKIILQEDASIAVSGQSLIKTNLKLLIANHAYRFMMLHTLHRLFMVRIPAYIKKSFMRK